MASSLSIDVSSGGASDADHDGLHHSAFAAVSSLALTDVIESPSSKIDQNKPLQLETNEVLPAVAATPKMHAAAEAGSGMSVPPRVNSTPSSSSSTASRHPQLSQHEIEDLLSRKDLLSTDYAWLEYLLRQKQIHKSDLSTEDILYFPVLPVSLSDKLISMLCSADAGRIRSMSDHPVVIFDTMSPNTTKVKICFVSKHRLCMAFPELRSV
jgi:hypothetical protein